MKAVLVNNAYRMMTVAHALEDSIEIGFADGARGRIPYKDIPGIEERTALSSLALPNPYEMVLGTVRGETVEIPGTSPATTAILPIAPRLRPLPCKEDGPSVNASGDFASLQV